jgi:hypothetical protein
MKIRCTVTIWKFLESKRRSGYVIIIEAYAKHLGTLENFNIFYLNSQLAIQLTFDDDTTNDG